MVVWRVPEPVPPSEHPFKYRLVYVVGGERVVGFDNERGKGDHKHVGGQELPYAFLDVERLIEEKHSAPELEREQIEETIHVAAPGADRLGEPALVHAEEFRAESAAEQRYVRERSDVVRGRQRKADLAAVDDTLR